METIMNNLIEEALTEYFGERCPDYHKECVCCKAWKEYDLMTRDYEASKTELLKKMDNIIEMIKDMDTDE